MGGCCLLEPGVKSKGNKNSKIKLVVALDGSQRVKNMQQPTKNTRARRGRDRIRRCGARQCGTLSNTAPAPPLVFLYHISSYNELKEMRQPATTHKNWQKHRDHGGRAALLSSDMELMDQCDPTCGRPVHGVGGGRG